MMLLPVSFFLHFYYLTGDSKHQSIDTWANERAAKNGMSHSFQIPSDIKPGTYVVRTELLALHANSPSMVMTPISGPEFYLACFNVEVAGSGTNASEGQTFPGAYKPGDKGLTFSPYYGTGSGVEKNSKYVSV
jgi:cellulase